MLDPSKKYCNDLINYSRYKTREVYVGKIPLGADNPIRIQSMTTTDTMDAIATAEQTIRMVEAGCEYVRITAPSIKEAENLANIKAELKKRGYDVPLIADIHFTPNAAETAARIVEKVRVNPGNYADKKSDRIVEYDDAGYNAELERIRDKFVPLIKICKEYGTAMRIGANHGSLSDRILNRYGDTPLGMAESALEFVRICEDENYRDIVLSMKASNTHVMIEAYRLLVNKMEAEGMNYPLHLGVTEAGDGEDGRIKSAVGIGALLEDGLGDTIRVSLTEEPENEIPVARKLVERYAEREQTHSESTTVNIPYDPFSYGKRKSVAVKNIGGTNVPVVIADLSRKQKIENEDLIALGLDYNKTIDKWNLDAQTPDYIFINKENAATPLPENVGKIIDFKDWNVLQNKTNIFPLLSADELIAEKELNSKIVFVEINADEFNAAIFEMIRGKKNLVIVLSHKTYEPISAQRKIFIDLTNQSIATPVVIKRNYVLNDFETAQLYAATDFGGLLVDGFGDGVWMNANDNFDAAFVNRLLFGVLQAARARISKTEYIACPSCGRTLFDLVEVTNKIRRKTEHLVGVKIGIMGCIVNGPGEMADADYGYVGSGPGKITLYRGKEIVMKNVPSGNAVDELINLIKSDGNWKEPENKKLQN